MKRFGRNTKKRYQQEIDRLQSKIELLESEIAYRSKLQADQKNELEEKNDIIDATANVLGNYFITLGATQSISHEIDPLYRFLLRRVLLRRVNNTNALALNFDSSVSVDVVRRTLEFSRSFDLCPEIEELGDCARVKLMTPAGRVYQAVSPKALETTPPPVLANILTKETEQFLARMIAKRQGVDYEN